MIWFIGSAALVLLMLASLVPKKPRRVSRLSEEERQAWIERDRRAWFEKERQAKVSSVYEPGGFPTLDD
jgi:hypothetical protein